MRAVGSSNLAIRFTDTCDIRLTVTGNGCDKYPGVPRAGLLQLYNPCPLTTNPVSQTTCAQSRFEIEGDRGVDLPRRPTDNQPGRFRPTATLPPTTLLLLSLRRR